jgi:hypothetical protein
MKPDGASGTNRSNDAFKNPLVAMQGTRSAAALRKLATIRAEAKEVRDKLRRPDQDSVRSV